MLVLAIVLAASVVRILAQTCHKSDLHTQCICSYLPPNCKLCGGLCTGKHGYNMHSQHGDTVCVEIVILDLAK